MTHTYEICGMTLFKEADDKLVKVADFQHGMDDDMRLLKTAPDLLEALEQLVLAFDVGDMMHTTLNGRGYAALTESREAIQKARG